MNRQFALSEGRRRVRGGYSQISKHAHTVALIFLLVGQESSRIPLIRIFTPNVLQPSMELDVHVKFEILENNLVSLPYTRSEERRTGCKCRLPSRCFDLS